MQSSQGHKAGDEQNLQDVYTQFLFAKPAEESADKPVAQNPDQIKAGKLCLQFFTYLCTGKMNAQVGGTSACAGPASTSRLPGTCVCVCSPRVCMHYAGMQLCVSHGSC